MEQNLSSETNNNSVGQETHRLLWNPKVRYYVHKSLPVVSILSQISPANALLSYLFKIYFDIIFQSATASLKGSFLVLKLYMHFSSTRRVLYDPPISSFFVSLPWYLVKSQSTYPRRDGSTWNYIYCFRVTSTISNLIKILSVACRRTGTLYSA
jgi:hypothetical protein